MKQPFELVLRYLQTISGKLNQSRFLPKVFNSFFIVFLLSSNLTGTVYASPNVSSDELAGTKPSQTVQNPSIDLTESFTGSNKDPQQNNSCIQAPEGLINMWPAEDNAQDILGDRHGTIQNGVSFAQGIAGQAFNLDGVNDYIDLGNWFNFQNFTISIWVKPGSSQQTYADIIDNNHRTNINWVLQQNVNQTNQYYWSTTPFDLIENTWQHVVISHDNNGTFNTYLDGALLSSVQIGAINYDGNQFLRIGAWGGGGRHWKGLIDEVKIYNRSLTGTEVTALFGATDTRICSATVDPTKSTLEVSGPVHADGIQEVIITATTLDVNSDPVSDVQVIFKVAGDGTNLEYINSTTDANGIISARLTSSIPGVKTISAYIVGKAGSPVIPKTVRGVFTGADISGTVFGDKNGNETLDSGEKGIAGIKLELEDDQGAVVAATSASPNGQYKFDGLESGSYHVVIRPSLEYGSGEERQNISLGAFQSSSGHNFGLFEAATVSGTVWDDIDQDEVIDAGELKLENVTISGATQSGTPQTATTNADGSYVLKAPVALPAGPANSRFNDPGYSITQGLDSQIFNHDFEKAVPSLDSSFNPQNYDFGTSGYVLEPSTFPANYDFEEGNLGEWQSSVFSVINNANTNGSFAAYKSHASPGGTLTSPAFTVPAEAQSLTWSWRNNYWDHTYFRLLNADTGGTLVAMYNNVGTGGNWFDYSFNISPYIGQNVKFQVENTDWNHYLYLDNIQLKVNIPDWTISGNMSFTNAVQIVNNVSTNDSSAVYKPNASSGGTLTSPAFTIPVGAQSLTWSWKTNYWDHTYFRLLDADTGGTLVAMYNNVGTGGNWYDYSFNITPYIGQNVKFQVENTDWNHYLYLDNIQFKANIPGWTINGNMSFTNAVQIVNNANTNGSAAAYKSHASSGGTLTSPAFTVPAEAQSLTWSWKTNYWDHTYFRLLNADTGGTLVAMYNNVGTGGNWFDYSFNISPYIGQNVKFQVENTDWNHYLYLDNIQLKVNIPGWTINGNMSFTNAVQIVNNVSTNGSFAVYKPNASSGGTLTSPAFTIPVGAQSLRWSWRNNYWDHTYFRLLNADTGGTLVAMYNNVGTGGNWADSSFNITPYIGQNVKFQVENTDWNHYLYLDNILITPAQTEDYTITEENLPGYSSSTDDLVEQTLRGGDHVTINFGDFTVDLGESSLDVDSISVVADDIDTTLVTVTIRDALGNPMANREVEVETTGSNVTIDQAESITNALGQVTALLSSTTAQTIDVKARDIVEDVVLPDIKQVTFIPGPFNATQSTIEVTPAVVSANGAMTATVVVTIRDAEDNSIAGHDVTLTNIGSAVITPSSGTSNAQGQVTFTLHSTTVQTINLGAEDQTVSEPLSSTSLLAFVATDPGVSTVSVLQDPVVANGISTAQITVTLKDDANVPVVGAPVHLIISGSNNTIGTEQVGSQAFSVGDTDQDGKVVVLLASSLAETKSISAIGQQLTLTQTADAVFVPGPVSLSTSSFEISPLTLVADGEEAAEVTVILKDAQENPIPGHSIQIEADGMTVEILPAEPAQTNSAGVVTATITSTDLGTATISAQDLTGQVFIGEPVDVEFTVGPTDAETSSIEVEGDNLVANGSAMATVLVTLMDEWGHPISGRDVLLTASGSGNLITPVPPATTDSNGTVEFTLKSTKAETKTLTVSDTTLDITIDDHPPVTFVPGPVSSGNSIISSNVTETPANGETPAIITVTARDANNNPISGADVVVDATGDAVIAESTAQTDSQGKTTREITNETPETVSVSATINGVVLNISQNIPTTFRGADVEVTQTVSPDALAGEPITYTIKVKNEGLMGASGITLTDTLPNGFEFTSQNSNTTPPLDFDEPTLTWTVGNLAPDEEITVELVAEIPQSAFGEVTNTATAQSDENTLEDNPTNNTNAFVTAVDAPAPAVIFASSSQVLQVYPGETVTSLPITIVNDGTGSTSTLTTALSSHLNNWVEVSANTIESLTPGESTTLTITANPPANKPYGVYLGNLEISDGRDGGNIQLVSVRVSPAQHSLVVNVDDEYGMLPGAVVSLQNTALYTRVTPDGIVSTYHPTYSGTTDAEGKVTFPTLDEGTYTYQLSAAYHGETGGSLEIETGEEDQSIDLMLNAVPGLHVGPAPLTLVVAAGQEANQTASVTNIGAAALQDINVEISGLPGWVKPVFSNALASLDPQEQAGFQIYANPPADTPSGWLTGKILVSGTGAPQVSVDININILAQAGARRDVHFAFKDEEGAPILSGAQIIVKRVKPSQITLNGKDIPYQPQFSQRADENGIVEFEGDQQLEVGEEYTYEAWAENFQLNAGSFTLQPASVPGDEDSEDAELIPLFLIADYFVYTWDVTEIPGGVDLTYLVSLTIHFKDGRPATKPEWCNPPKCEWDPDTGRAGWRMGGGGGGGPVLPIPLRRQKSGFLLLSHTTILSWQAFHAILWLKNVSLPTFSNVTAEIKFVDSDAEDGIGDFVIQPSASVAFGSLSTDDEGAADWIILPKDIDVEEIFRVYAEITYQKDGITETVRTSPEFIIVKPSPELTITYQSPSPAISCEKFDIRATVTNIGAGPAVNLRFYDVKPESRGDYTFSLEGATIDGVTQIDPLNIFLGDIPAGASRSVVWHFTPTPYEPVRVDYARARLKEGVGIVGLPPVITEVRTTASSTCLVSQDLTEDPLNATRWNLKGIKDYIKATGAANQYEVNSDCTAGECGDPIDTRTGVFSLGLPDLSFPTSAGDLTFQRAYSSGTVTKYTGLLGYGWTHNHDLMLIFPPAVSTQLHVPGAPAEQGEPPQGIDGYVLFKDTLGNMSPFKIEQNGSFTPGPGVLATLTHISSGAGHYILTTPEQAVFTFDESGKITSLADPQDNAFTYTYNTSGKLTRVSADDDTRYINLGYDSQGRITSVSNYADQQVTYSYDDVGDLVSSTDILERVWTFTYNVGHRMTQVSDPSGKETVTTVYDLQGRATRQWDGNGDLLVRIVYNFDGTTEVYDANDNLQADTYDSHGMISESVDELDRTTEITYDPNFRPTVMENDAGQTVSMEWSEDGRNLLAQTDAAGNRTEYTYDTLNNLIETCAGGYENHPCDQITEYVYMEKLLMSETNPLDQTTTYTYTSEGWLESETDHTGRITSYTYNDHGEPISTCTGGYAGHPCDQTTISTYDNLGRLIETEDARGRVTLNEYNDAGQLLRSTANYDSNRPPNDENLYNIVTIYTYDVRGNQTSVTDTYGHTTHYEYDDADRLVKTTDAAGNFTINTYDDAGLLIAVCTGGYENHPCDRTTEYTYDAGGRQLSTLNALDQSSGTTTFDVEANTATVTDAAQHATTYFYDDLNRPFKVTNPLGHSSTTTYDENGNVSMRTDELNRVTHYEYDALNRLIKTTDPLGGITETIYDPVTSHRSATIDALDNQTTYAYDELGRLITTTDRLEHTTHTEYDAFGRRAASIDAAGHRTTYTYDLLDRVTAVCKDGDQTLPDACITTSYNALGNVIASTDANNHTTYKTYDELNRVETITDANGNTITNTYDAVGNLIAVTDALDQVTTYTYDLLNRQIAVTDPLGHTTHQSHDILGNLTDKIDANGVVTHFEYDALNRQVAVVQNYRPGFVADVHTNVRTEYIYNEVGNRTKVKDPNNHETTFTYDVLNRVTNKLDPIGNTWVYTYNLVGNRLSMTDGNDKTTNFTYDDAHQLILIDYPAPDADVSFTYTETGQRASMTTAGPSAGPGQVLGTTTWEYDVFDRLVSVTDPNNKTIYYEYDAVGNRTKLIYPDGKEVDYTYNPANRLTAVADWDEQTTEYGYDPLGRLLSVLRPNDVDSSYSYDQAGRLTELQHNIDTNILASYQYEYDPAGNRIRAIEGVQQPHTPTPTATVTETVTSTPTVTETPTETSTPTSTFTATPTATLTPTPTPQVTLVASITAGQYHTCVLTTSGAVKCWGYNAMGQLGDNTTTARLTPINVSGLTSGVTAINAGQYHTCALTTSGGVKCWGQNTSGKLGDGTTTQRKTPVDVSGLTSGVAAIAAGISHTCALTTGGGVKCWGGNGNGQLGDGTTTARTTPVDVTGLTSGIAAIAAGSNFTCALTTSGGMKCWGLNGNGQLGNGTTNIQSTAPVDVSGLSSGVTAIHRGSISSHTCAVTSSDGTKCWGYNGNGQLGDSSTTQSNIPVNVSGLSSGAAIIATGSSHTCTVTTNGGAKCWGSNSTGQLGDGTTTQRTTPVDVSGFNSGVTTLAAGAAHTCLVTTNGGVKCWGQNWTGQLGDGTTTDRTTPVEVFGGSPTPTPTNAPAFTATMTPTVTATPTSTETLTETLTPTPTVTHTETMTPTITDTPTETLTPTSTFTATSVGGNKPSGIHLAAFHPRQANDEDPTPTPTATTTETAAPSPTVTATQTAAPTADPQGPLTIDYTYDLLNRLTSASYSNGTDFDYSYDAAGNTLEYDRTIGGQTVTTTYTYDAADQLVTAQAGVGAVEHYTYDGNGSLIEFAPDVSSLDGARRYTYNTAGFLSAVETHDATDWNPQAEMAYDGLGGRLAMTAFADPNNPGAGGQSITTQYELDSGYVLSATAGQDTTTFLYGLGPIGELTDAWVYALPDGASTQRQVSNANGEITFASSYTPWGNTLSVTGTGSVTQGYLGGIMDTATGLIYVGGGQYYDPQTGRFLTRNARPDQTNPYVPWGTNPTGALIAPLALLSLFYKRKRKRGKLDTFVILCVLCLGVSASLAACGVMPTGNLPVGAQFNIVRTETPYPMYAVDLSVPGTSVRRVANLPAETPSETPELPCQDVTLSLRRVPFGIDEVLKLYGVTLTEGVNNQTNWTETRKIAIRDAVMAVALKMSDTIEGGFFPIEVFRRVYGGGVNFTWVRGTGRTPDCTDIEGGGCTISNNRITFASMSIVENSARNNVVHELGHAFSAAMEILHGADGGDVPWQKLVDDRATNRGLIRGENPSYFYGFASHGDGIWQQHSCSHDAPSDAERPCQGGSEIFADQFLGWTFDTWDPREEPEPRQDEPDGVPAQGRVRADWMNSNMGTWLNRIFR